MELIICAQQFEAARIVADAVQSLLHRRPAAALGFATGSSPEAVYAELARRRTAGAIDFSQIRAFMLDEYLGISPDHPQSYRQVVEREVVGPLGLSPGQLHALDSMSSDPPATAEAYEAAIRASGPIDLQLLGLGHDGHVGFNEPGSSLGSRTRVKTLTDQTRDANARFFGDDPAAVPRHVITQGIATILDARHLVLLAWGAEKAAAVAQTVEGPITASVPASVLQLHPHVTVLIDEPAASMLARADYARAVYAAKPSWQTI